VLCRADQAQHSTSLQSVLPLYHHNQLLFHPQTAQEEKVMWLTRTKSEQGPLVILRGLRTTFRAGLRLIHCYGRSVGIHYKVLFFFFFFCSQGFQRTVCKHPWILSDFPVTFDMTWRPPLLVFPHHAIALLLISDTLQPPTLNTPGTHPAGQRRATGRTTPHSSLSMLIRCGVMEEHFAKAPVKEWATD